jgi:hypothetical protein
MGICIHPRVGKRKRIATIPTPKISEEEKCISEGYLSVNECYAALQKLGSSKSPGTGNDGLSNGFYAFLWPKLGHLLADCLNEGFDECCFKNKLLSL